MKEIPLTKGQVARVDDEDFEYLSQFNWNAHEEGKTCYAYRGIANGKKRRTNIKMHREIMKVTKGIEVDHVDGDGLNNCRSNLRLCTHQQNHFNTSSRRNSSSKYKGVIWDKSRGKWQAKIKHGGKTVHLGRFASEDTAATAYNRAAMEFYGEFARLNIIEEALCG